MSSLQPCNYDDISGSHDPQNCRPLQENFSNEIEKKGSSLCELLLVFKCVIDVYVGMEFSVEQSSIYSQ